MSEAVPSINLCSHPSRLGSAPGTGRTDESAPPMSNSTISLRFSGVSTRIECFPAGISDTGTEIVLPSIETAVTSLKNISENM